MTTKQESSQDKVTAKSILGQNKGQLIVEYILLIFIVAVAAVLMSRLLVSREDGNAGLITTKWTQLLELIGSDVGD